MRANCIICNTECEINDYKDQKRVLGAYCSDSCRGMYYRNLERRNKIQKFIETGNMDLIKSMRVKDIMRLFPTIKIQMEIQ